MKKVNLVVFTIIWGVMSSFAQQNVVDFEELTLEPETYWNGNDMSGKFISKFLTFFNEYDPQWDTWGGFAYSNQTDTESQSWENFSSAQGGGALGSQNFAIAYFSDFNNSTGIKIDKDLLQETINGMYISLSAYSSLYMEDNDFFQNGNHMFKLIISAYNTENRSKIEKEIIMADYRFNNTSGYKFDEWTYIDMSWINDADSLYFVMESTDVGEWGINTPTYFCLDHINSDPPAEIPAFFVEISENISIEPGEETEIMVIAKGGVQPYYYQWNNQESLSDISVQNPVANPETTTYYSVTVTDSHGNSEIKTVSVYVGTNSINEMKSEKSRVNYCFDGYLDVKSDFNIEKISVFDVTGRRIRVINVNSNEFHGKVNVPDSALYILKIFSDAGIETHKVFFN